MGYFKPIETYVTGAAEDLTPGKVRRLFSCELHLGPGHTEETHFMAGLDSEGAHFAIWKETEWDMEAGGAVAWTAKAAFAEPEVWRRLLDAYLRAAKEEEGFDGSEFTSLVTSPRGPLPKSEIRAIIAKVFGTSGPRDLG
jgi:hypothetical protein